MSRGCSFGALLLLSSCVANMAAPITMPIWILFSFSFLVDKELKPLWKIITYLSMTQILLIAGFWALFSAGKDLPFWLSILPLCGFMTTWISIHLMGGDSNSLRQRRVGFLFQVFAAMSAVLPLLITALEARR